MCDVLIIDNDDSGSRAMADDLVAAGYTVRTANNVFEAIRSVQAFQPRVVFVEINLPGWLDGSVLAGKIARLDPEISIVMMSTDVEAIQKAQDEQSNNAVAIIEKPLPAGPIKRFVQLVCQVRREEVSVGH